MSVFFSPFFTKSGLKVKKYQVWKFPNLKVFFIRKTMSVFFINQSKNSVLLLCQINKRRVRFVILEEKKISLNGDPEPKKRTKNGRKKRSLNVAWCVHFQIIDHDRHHLLGFLWTKLSVRFTIAEILPPTRWRVWDIPEFHFCSIR